MRYSVAIVILEACLLIVTVMTPVTMAVESLITKEKRSHYVNAKYTVTLCFILKNRFLRV